MRRTVTNRVDGGVRRLVAMLPEARQRLRAVQPGGAVVRDTRQRVVLPVQEAGLDRRPEPGEHLQGVQLVVAVAALSCAQALSLRHLSYKIQR